MATSPTAEREKRTAFPTNVPTRSPYEGSMVSQAAQKLASAQAPRAPDGSMAGPGATPYAPYRMGPQASQLAAPPVAQPAAAAPAAPRAPIPAVGTMPMEPDVQGPSRNPLAGAAAALSGVNTNGFMADTRAVMSQSGQAMSELAGQGRYGAVAGEALRATTAMVPALANDVLIRPAAPMLAGAVDAGRQFLGMNDPRSAQGDTSRTQNPAADQGAGKPPAEAAAAANKPQAAPGTPAAAATMAAPATPTAPAAPGAPGSTGQVNVRRQPNGVMEFSGTNVAGPVSYNGAEAAGFRPSGAGVSVVPGMRPGEAQAILARPFDPAGGLNGGQRAVYDAQVAQAQAINAADAARGTGRIGDYIRSGQARRALVNQNLQGANDERQQQMASRSAADVLAQRRQDESEANSSVTRRTNEVTAQGAEQIQELRNRVLNAATPEERDTAAKQLQAISGKEQENRYTRVSAGSQIDPTTGAVIQLPDVLVDNRTGRPVNLSGAAPGQGQGAAAPVTPPPDAITFLRDKGRNDPAVAAAFDEKYGPGAAARYLR